MRDYIVKSGDTLYSIALQFGTTVDAIKRLNNLNNNLLSIGQVLKISNNNNNSNSTTYTVQNGDTLYGIAKQFGTSVDNIKRLNNLNNNVIIVGQVLRINEDTNPTTYTVKSGDTLYSISRQFNIPVLDLMRANNITSTILRVGQVLTLLTNEEENPGGVIGIPIYENYSVQRGDSLYSIAQKFNTTVNQIKEDNNLTSNLLTIGQVLRIKVGEELIGIEECYGEGYSELDKNYLTYVVKRGDSLYSIAKSYNTSVDQLIRLNNLTNTNLDIGQVLKIREVN